MYLQFNTLDSFLKILCTKAFFFSFNRYALPVHNTSNTSLIQITVYHLPISEVVTNKSREKMYIFTVCIGRSDYRMSVMEPCSYSLCHTE